MRQTWALLVDSYRDMNARKMFWIVLILSTLVAASFAAVGLTPTGIKVLIWDFDFFVNSRLITPGTFYKMMFLILGIGYWLTGWLATGLALISTASIFPDFLSGGAIDLFLSKPISRLRLFLTKYLGGLLFVALQITCFCLASYLVIGLRGKVWEPGIFLAVPIVVLFFSYLYCVCVLIGVVTRSTIAAILLTILFWVAIWGIHTSEILLLRQNIDESVRSAQLDKEIIAYQEEIDRTRQAPPSSEPATTEPATDPSTGQATLLPNFLGKFMGLSHPTDPRSMRISRLQLELDQAQQERSQLVGKFTRAHDILFGVKTFLPKTSETVDLLDRQLVKHADLKNLPGQRDPDQDGSDEDDNAHGPRGTRSPHQRAVNREFQEELNKRSVGWIVGTSVGFEAVVLGLAAWIFCRRDY